MKLIETICYECYAGSDFDTFAEEVINDVKKHGRDSLMAFNGAFIRVNQISTLESLWEEYQKICKDAFDLIRFENVNVQKTNVMTNEQKASEIANKYSGREIDRIAILEMAKWKDSQPQIIEIFGKRVKAVKDNDNTADGCMKCTFIEVCQYTIRGNLCQSADKKFNRHFVEVDEDGNEIK